jgi:hypothetical protein
MGANKDLFSLLRQQEIKTENYFLSKKEIENSGRLFAKQILSHGEIDKYELFSQAERLATVTANIRDEIKSHLPKEKNIAFGIQINPVSGRTMIQFQDDLVWSELKEKMQQREELLKVALKSNEPFYDSEGCEVPKVSVKYSADSLTVKY